MIEGTYSIMLKTPLGVKKGELIFYVDGTVLHGSLVALGKINTFFGGTVDGDRFKFIGELISPMGKIRYECTGTVDRDNLTATAVTKKGKFKITGTRKV